MFNVTIRTCTLPGLRLYVIIFSSLSSGELRALIMSCLAWSAADRPHVAELAARFDAVFQVCRLNFPLYVRLPVLVSASSCLWAMFSRFLCLCSIQMVMRACGLPAQCGRVQARVAKVKALYALQAESERVRDAKEQAARAQAAADARAAQLEAEKKAAEKKAAADKAAAAQKAAAAAQKAAADAVAAKQAAKDRALAALSPVRFISGFIPRLIIIIYIYLSFAHSFAPLFYLLSAGSVVRCRRPALSSMTICPQLPLASMCSSANMVVWLDARRCGASCTTVRNSAAKRRRGSACWVRATSMSAAG